MQQQFMFSSLPVNQCFFCKQNGVPLMIMGRSKYTDKLFGQASQNLGNPATGKQDASFAPPVTIKNVKLII